MTEVWDEVKGDPSQELARLKAKGQRIVRLQWGLTYLAVAVTISAIVILIYLPLQGVQFDIEYLGLSVASSGILIVVTLILRLITEQAILALLGLDALILALSQTKTFMGSQFKIRRGMMANIAIVGTLHLSRHDVLARLELDSGRWGGYVDAPVMIVLCARWERPDDLLIGRDAFYAELTGMHRLQEFAFIKDLWEYHWPASWDGIYTNWGSNTLDLRICPDVKAPLGQNLASRVCAAIDAFAMVIDVSEDLIGKYSTKLIETTTRKPLPLYMFGRVRVQYCEHCDRPVSRGKSILERCPRCGNRTVRILARSDPLYPEPPGGMVRELKAFTGELPTSIS